MNKRINKWRCFLAVFLLIAMFAALIPQQTIAAEDYRTWDQADERWGSLELGTSGKSVANSGCLVTCVTKLIIQAGLKKAEEFTPATLVKWLNENEGFSGASLYWAKPAEYVDGLSYYSSKLLSSGTYDIDEYTDDIINWVKEGFHIILQVKGGGHWVLVDEAMTLAHGEIYIMDSQPYNQNADIRLEDRYSDFSRAEAYKGGITPDGGIVEAPDEEEPDLEEPDADEDPDMEGPDEEQPDQVPDGQPEEEPDEEPDMEEPVIENPFVDVDESEYYYDAVLWAYEKGITKGTDDTHFSPDNSCTRSEIVTFLWRAKGCPNPETKESPFLDVTNEDEFYYKAVLWAVKNGITTGVDEAHFNPDDICTRNQIVTFIWRAAGQPGSNAENHFEDVSNEAYYAEAVLWAVENGITTGVDETHFDPENTCTRGQAVTFLYRQDEIKAKE